MQKGWKEKEGTEATFKCYKLEPSWTHAIGELNVAPLGEKCHVTPFGKKYSCGYTCSARSSSKWKVMVGNPSSTLQEKWTQQLES